MVKNYEYYFAEASTTLGKILLSIPSHIRSFVLLHALSALKKSGQETWNDNYRHSTTHEQCS